MTQVDRSFDKEEIEGYYVQVSAGGEVIYVLEDDAYKYPEQKKQKGLDPVKDSIDVWVRNSDAKLW